MTPQLRIRLQWVAVHSFAVACLLFFVLPFVFVALTAVMTDEQSLTRELWPHPFQWHNLVDVWHTEGFPTWWRNTLIYAVGGTRSGSRRCARRRSGCATGTGRATGRGSATASRSSPR